MAPRLTADDLGEIIADAFHDVNDVGGMTPACWALVAEKVAAALSVKLGAEVPAMVPQICQQQASASRDPSDYWIVRLDGAFAVRSHRNGIEAEGIPCWASAQAVIDDLEEADRIEAEDEAAAQADFDAQFLMDEAA